MKSKKSAGDFAINKIMVLILVVLAIAVVFMFLFRQDIFDYFNNLPYTYNESDSEIDYSKLTPDELLRFDCKSTGKIIQDYIFIGGVKTNIYLRGNDVLLYLGKGEAFKNRLGFGEVVIIGEFKDNKIKINPNFLSEDSQYYLEHKNLLPGILELKFIDGSFLLGTNLLCKKEQEIASFKKEESCLEKCEIHNGICKEKGENNEISFGKIDCKENQNCYVKISEEKLEDEDLIISEFYSAYIDFNVRPPGYSFLSKNIIEVLAGKKQIVSFSGYYPKTGSFDFGKISKPFCYLFRTDKEILDLKYYKNTENNGEKIDKMWTASNEKIFELAVWAPWDNKKILKRVQIQTKINANFEGGSFLSDENFRQETLKKDSGIFFVVDAPFKFSDGRIISDYKIIKYSNKIEVYGNYYVNNKEDWYEIDCYTGFMGFISIGINLDKIENSLTETLIKNKCKQRK
jgi:hypothetical protein